MTHHTPLTTEQRCMRRYVHACLAALAAWLLLFLLLGSIAAS